MNRRKLGTSRRNKGKQRVNDPETQPDVESRERVQEEASGNEHPESQASARKQPKVQEEVAQEGERDMTAPQAAFLVSATTAEYAEDKTDILCPEEVKHILDSKDVGTQPLKDETKLEVIESNNTLQSEEVNENLHDRLPVSASASNRQMISTQAEDFNLHSVAELNSSKQDDSGLFRQDGRLQGNFSVCESRVNTSITPEITADNAFRKNLKINDGVEQEALLFQTEELPTSKDDKHFTPEVRDAKLSQEVEDNQYNQNKLAQQQIELEKDNSTEDLLYDHKDYGSYFENQKSESDSYQSLFLVKGTAVKQDVLTTTEETSLDHMNQSGGLVEDNIQTLPSDFKSTTKPQLHNSSLTTDDHTKAGFSSGATKRKIGSSRKNKGRRHLKDSEEDESLETPTVLSEIQVTGHEEVSDVTAADSILPLSNRDSVRLVLPHDLTSEYPEPDTYSSILTSESLQKGQDKTNSEILAQKVENSGVAQHEVDQSDVLHSEPPLLEDVPTNLQKVQFHPTQMQEILQIQHSSELILDYVTEHFENISESLNEPEMSESAGMSTDDVSTKLQEHQTEENILTHSVEQKNESYDLYDANSLQIINLEKSNSTPTQISEFKKGVEDDIKLTADQIYHQEKGLFEIGEENPVLIDSQPQETSWIVDEQSTKAFYSSGKGGKLESIHKSRGKHDKDSKEEVKEKTSDEETTQILDTKIMSQEELRLDILPVSYDSPNLSIFAPGHSLEDPESLIPGSVNIPESQENSETDINMDLSDKSREETLGRQSETHKSKSGSLQTKEVSDPDVDMRKGQEHKALQEPEPQQIDYIVAGKVEEVGVFVENTKHDPSNPLLQDNSLSTNEQNDTGFSGSRRKLGSSQREKQRQQGEIPKQEVLESTRDDEIHERPARLMQEELTEDSELRTTTSVSNNSLFPNSPLGQSFTELSCVPTKYSEPDLEDTSVNSENFQKNQNESKLDTENNMDVSHRAMDEFEDNFDAVAGEKEIMDGEHSDNTVKQDQENEDPLKDIEGNLELDYISETVAHDIPIYPETVLGGLVDQAKVTSNIYSELTVKSTEDSATKHKLKLTEDQQNMCFTAEGNVEALDQTSKDDHLHDSKETSIGSPDLGQIDKGGSLEEGSEHNPTDPNLQDTSLTTNEQIGADFSSKGNRRKLGSSRRKKGRQDVKESNQEVLENNGGEKGINTSPVILKVKTSEQEELSKASEEEMFWSHSISMSHVLSYEDQTSEVPEEPLKGLIMKCENHQEDIDKGNFNVLVQEDLSLSQCKAHTEDTRYTGLEDVLVEHLEEVHSITMQDNSSETSTNINKTFDIPSENLTGQNVRSQLTVNGNDDFTEKLEKCPTEEMISETLDLKSGETVQDDTKPKIDQIFHEEKEGVFCEMEENKHVLSNFQMETVSLDPKPQETSESTEEQINTDFSSSASRQKLESSRKGKARRQVNEFKDEVNETTRVDETHRTPPTSLDTKTISHEEKRQDMEQDATLLVSHDNSFSVLACGDSSEVQDPIQKNHPKVELDSLIQGIVNCPENQNQSEFLQSKDRMLQNKVIGGELSDNALKRAQENEDLPTNIEGNLEMDYTPETVARDVPKYPETALEGVIDQAEISSKIHSELTLKHTEDSGTEQELLPAEDQQNLRSTTERNLEALNQTSKDDHLHDSKETSISGPVEVNTILGHMDEGGTLEEGSEHNSNVQDGSLSTNEQTTDGFSFNGNRRKLGSSRKNKGRPGFKESKQEVFENYRSVETPQTSTTSVETRGAELEELSGDIEHKIILSLSQDLSSVSSHILSSENQSSVLKNDSDTDLQILTLNNEHFGDEGERRSETEVEMVEKSMNVLQEVGQSDAVHSEDTRDAEAEDALREVEKIEFHPTQMQDSTQTECYSETVLGNVSENEEVVPENLTDQAGMSELSVKATDDSARKEETYSVKKNHPENLDVINEDSGVFDNNKPQITDLEKTKSVPTEMNEFEGRISDDQMGEGGSLVESTAQNPKETKHQENSLTTDEQTDAGLHGSRRKLGSSRRKKGRQQGKESQEEALENTSDDKTFEMPTMSLETKTVEQQEHREENKQEMILSVSHDSSLSLIPPVISSHDQSSSVPTNYPDEDVQSLTLKNENLHEDVDDRKSDVLTSDEGKQNVFQGDTRNAVSENVVHEVHSTQIQDSVQTHSDNIFAGDATENADIISRALTDQTEESELNMNSVDDIASIEEACSSKEIISAAPGLKNEETIQQDVQPNTDHMFNQNNEVLVLQMEENKFARSNLQPENASSGSHPLESSKRVEEQTKVDSHSRRKLGSSRRNKGRGKAKDIDQPITEVDLNASMNELGEKTTETLAQDHETLMGIVLGETKENDSSQTKDANISSSLCTTEGMQLSPIVDQEDSDTSCCTQITDRELPKHHSRDHDEYRELQDGNLQESTSLPEPHAGPSPAELHAEKNSSCEHTEPESGDGDAFKKTFEQETKSEQKQKMFEAAGKERDDIAEYPEAFSRNMFSENEKNTMNEKTEVLQPDKNVRSEQLSEPPERTAEKGSNMQKAQVEYSIEQGAVSSPQQIVYTDGEEHRHIVLSTAAETHYLLDVQSKEQKEQVKSEQMQEMHQISFPNDKFLRETMQSDKNATLDSDQDLKDDTHPGFKASGNRRKLGSSRRTKERKHSQINEQNKEKLLEENTVSSHNVLEDSAIAKSDFNSNSDQENSIKSNVETKEKDSTHIDEAQDSTELTGHDTNKMGFTGQHPVLSSDSDMQSILFHDAVIRPKSESVYVIDHEEALQRQKTEALSCEKDPPGAEVHLKETNKEIETAGFITTEVCSSQVESSVDVQHLKKGEVEGKYMHASKQKNTSNEFISASQGPTMDAPYEGGISATMNPLESQGEKPQETSKQKKRKIGSSRRIPLNRKRDGERLEEDEAEESDFTAKAEMTNLGEMEIVGKVLVNEEVLQGKDVQPQQEASLQQETPETETGDGLQSSNMSLAFPPEQPATIDLILETPKPDDVTNSQTQICSEDTERNSSSLNQPVSSNTGTPGGSLECTQGDEPSPESTEVRQVQDAPEQMPSSTIESIHSQKPGMRTGSPDSTPTNRRRKMGSTRKNLGTRTKQEILEPEKESTDTVLSSGDVTEASVSGKKETERQLHTERADNTYQEKQKENVEISQFGESLLRALAEEEMAEESSISQTQTTETKQQWNPSGLSSSPYNDGTSESAFGGRRKKFGSNRKSGLQQRKSDENAQNEDEAGGLIKGSALKAAEREESSGLRKISEVDENGQKPSSSTGILEATGSSKSMRDKTPEKPVHGNIRLDQETGSQLSLGATSGADKSDGYNVVMIGESCVGKTSFMKRAQSGKFSLDIPASVGLDSCKWTVVVDGKPVVLQLWDTAGQERFHSITRQVFHKAQAFLLMYDITSSQSFSAVSYWANSIQEAAAEDVTVLLLGNKSEHAKRQVKTEQGDILAKEYNFEFMECSAATGENVIEALEAVARMLSQRADLLREEVTVLHKEPAQRKSSKCC